MRDALLNLYQSRMAFFSVALNLSVMKGLGRSTRERTHHILAIDEHEDCLCALAIPEPVYGPREFFGVDECSCGGNIVLVGSLELHLPRLLLGRRVLQGGRLWMPCGEPGQWGGVHVVKVWGGM